MNAREFCYWLQGHFELNPSTRSFTASQWDCVAKHLALCVKYDKDKNDFVKYLEGVFEALGRNLPGDYLVISMKKKLSETFEHEIDTTYGNLEVQMELNKIHNGDGEEKMRC